MIRERIDAMAVMLEGLVNAPCSDIDALLASKPTAASVPGVYAISAPGDPNCILYVGRTKTKTILGRLSDHCRIDTPSDLRGMLTRHLVYPQNPRSYGVRWCQVDEDVVRAQLELFAIAVLKPPFNRYA